MRGNFWSHFFPQIVRIFRMIHNAKLSDFSLDHVGLSSLRIYTAASSSPYLLFGECWSKAQPNRGHNQSSLCLRLTLRSHVIASHWTDYFQPPRSILSPRSPLWLARVTGYLLHNHRRTALGSPKAKTPQDALWSWLLARATARRLTLIKNLACRLARPQKNLRGSQLALSSRCHSRRFGLYTIFQTMLDATTSIAKFLPLAQLPIGKPQPCLCQESLQAHSVTLPTGLIALLSSEHCKVD